MRVEIPRKVGVLEFWGNSEVILTSHEIVALLMCQEIKRAMDETVQSSLSWWDRCSDTDRFLGCLSSINRLLVFV